MAAREDEPQRIERLGLALIAGEYVRNLCALFVDHSLVAQNIELVARGGYEPRDRIARRARAGPLHERRREGFLQRILRDAEITDGTDDFFRHLQRRPETALDKLEMLTGAAAFSSGAKMATRSSSNAQRSSLAVFRS